MEFMEFIMEILEWVLSFIQGMSPQESILVLILVFQFILALLVIYLQVTKTKTILESWKIIEQALEDKRITQAEQDQIIKSCEPLVDEIKDLSNKAKNSGVFKLAWYLVTITLKKNGMCR